MSGTLIAALAMLGTMILTSLYGLATSAIRKRVTISSPESKAIEQLIPTVNALLEMQGPQTRALIAILEAQKGQCNGNVDEALVVTRAAHKRFNDFLTDSARVAL
jgi:hypothetical protein